MIEPSALHVLFFLALCDTVMSVNWPGIYNEAIMMAYLDIPISGISLFSKVSIASEDIFLENLTRLPSKDVKSTSVGSSRLSHTNVPEGLAPAPLVLILVWPSLFELWNSGPTAPRRLAGSSCSRSIDLTKEDIVEFNLAKESSDIITNNRLSRLHKNCTATWLRWRWHQIAQMATDGVISGQNQLKTIKCNVLR